MNQESYKFKLFVKTTPKPLHQLMCPLPGYKKLGAKNIDTKCQTEEVCRLFYVFQKERHGFDRSTSISLSIHPSISLSIHHNASFFNSFQFYFIVNNINSILINFYFSIKNSLKILIVQ